MAKTALITGAGRRIGAAMALALAGDGWALAIHHRQSDRAALALTARINGRGGRALPVSCDLSDEAAVADMAGEVHSRLGPTGLLINNAARFEPDDDTARSWEGHFAVNLRAPFLLTRLFARNRVAPGLIVNMLDYAVVRPPGDFIAYNLSKSALWTLTRTMAGRLAPHIRVNAIAPGPSIRGIRQSRAHFHAMVARAPLARAARAADIIHTLRHIIATDSMTGQMILLDGGMHLTGDAGKTGQ